MKITFLCTDVSHPVNNHLMCWIQNNHEAHEITLVRSRKELPGGDILFLISCSEIVSASDRSAYRTSLVLHASDLPHGRGWSPHIWAIIGGAEQLTITLLEAEDKVDSGRIWHKLIVEIPKHALWNEINEHVFNAEIELLDFAVAQFDTVSPIPQDASIEPTYYARRKPDDSKIDVERNLAAQFNLIRVCDPERFPAFFELHGHKYKLSLEKIYDEADHN